MNQFGDSHNGYNALQGHSAAITRKSVATHRDLVETWLSALDLYFDRLKSFNTIPSQDEDTHFSIVTRFAFLSLGIGHSKAALDSTCRGDYHHAFFSIRYMGELIIQGLYIRLKRDEARRWYKRYSGKGTAHFVPSLDKTYTKVRDALVDESEAATKMVELVRQVMKEADKWGAHPSQEVLEQIMAQSGDHLMLGSWYQPDSCRVALDRGLLVTLLLVEELFQELTPDSEEFLALRKSLWDERQRLMRDSWDST